MLKSTPKPADLFETLTKASWRSLEFRISRLKWLAESSVFASTAKLLSLHLFLFDPKDQLCKIVTQ
jgi:hypothetical protein